MKKHTPYHLLCFTLASSVIFAGSTVYYANREVQYERYAKTQHEHVLSQLLNSMNQLETSLEKAQYLPEGGLRQTIAADIWKESHLAAAALSSLPLNDRRLEQVETYISQVGDYAYYLMRSSAYERANEAEWGILFDLCGNAGELLREIDLMKQQLDTGSLTLSVGSANKELQAHLNKVNDEFPEYASLIYDGPYSDHITQRKPAALEGQKMITREQALEIAAKAMDKQVSELSFDYESEGTIPCYGFFAGTAAAALSKQGGFLLSFTDTRPIGEAKLSSEQAIVKAHDFLRTIGLPEMQPSYHTTYEAVMTVNFHSYENGVLAYPDLIKVGVALDDGSVVRFDASGFAMNYHVRPAARPAVDPDSARKTVADDLMIQRETLCYIPTTGCSEVLCWELACTSAEGGHVLQYVNCKTGQIENLLLLIETGSGTLTR